jgi:DDE superfamily endonuclease
MVSKGASRNSSVYYSNELPLQRHLSLTGEWPPGTLLRQIAHSRGRPRRVPAWRTAEAASTLPTVDVVPGDVEGGMDELGAGQAAFHDCVARSEPRAHFLDEMVGQLSPLERKSSAPMALRIEGGTGRGLQRVLSDGPWDEEQRLWHAHQLVAAAMGVPEGVRRCAETAVVKQGTDAAGGARQAWGPLGKVAPCQGGVLAGSASRHGAAGVDKRRCLPEAWWTAAYATRRPRGNVPTALTFQSPPPLAAAMLQRIGREGLLPCKAVGAAGL